MSLRDSHVSTTTRAVNGSRAEADTREVELRLREAGA